MQAIPLEREGRSCRSAARSGFTLLELLTGLAILAIMVLFLAQIFTQSTKSWERGTTQVLRNAAARAALEMLAGELELAVADHQIAFKKQLISVGEVTDGRDPITPQDTIYFVTLGGQPDDGRLYQQLGYEVRSYGTSNANKIAYTTYRLYRIERNFDDACQAGTDPLGLNTNWWGPNEDVWWSSLNRITFEFLIEDVVKFAVYLQTADPERYGENATGTAPEDDFVSSEPPPKIQYPYDRHKMPPFLDILLQVATPDAMLRATVLVNNGRRDQAMELLNRESNVFMTRVYPKMRPAEEAYPIPQYD